MSGFRQREVVSPGTGCHSRELLYGTGCERELKRRYNVTPTAAYTYAPAYRRYGHKINAVHFIGPHKPWASLGQRPAGMSRVTEGKEQTYDCEYSWMVIV